MFKAQTAGIEVSNAVSNLEAKKNKTKGCGILVLQKSTQYGEAFHR